MTESTEITKSMFTTEQLSDVQSFEDVFALVKSAGGTVVDAGELGDGFTLHPGGKDKSAFIGKPMMFVSWSFSQGDYDDEFATCRVIVQDDAKGKSFSKWVINDGSTGIRDQLRALSAKGTNGGLFVARGLRKSDYTATLADGTKSPATTYYIDTSAS